MLNHAHFPSQKIIFKKIQKTPRKKSLFISSTNLKKNPFEVNISEFYKAMYKTTAAAKMT